MEIDLTSQSNDADLQGALTISGNLTIDDGDLDTNNNQVSVDEGLFVQAGGEFDGAGDPADHEVGCVDIDASGIFVVASGS